MTLNSPVERSRSDLYQSALSSRARMAPAGPQRPAAWAARPVLYDFGGGRPDPESLPFAGLTRATAEVLEQDGRAALTYGNIQGFEGLRELVAWKMEHREGLTVSPDEVFITNGSSQALALIADTFLDPGDLAIVEAPTFSGSLNIFRRRGAEVIGVPLDDEGLRTDDLERLLKGLAAQGKRPKFVYTIDYFHNPAGPCLSVERRHDLLRIAEAYGTLVVEDEAYGDLRYDGESPPSLYALDEAGLIMRCSTLSKILAAGVRIGWILAPAELLHPLMAMKQDWGTSPFVSRVAAQFLRAHMDEHITELCGVYRRKRDAMLAGLERGLGDTARWSHPEGGFFVWLRLPGGTDLAKLMEGCVERQISIVPGSNFFPDGGGKEHIRLAFSYAPVPAISEGMDKLVEAIRLAR